MRSGEKAEPPAHYNEILKIHAFRLNQRHFILTKNAERMYTKRSLPDTTDSDVIRYVITITGLCIFCWYKFRSGVSKWVYNNSLITQNTKLQVVY